MSGHGRGIQVDLSRLDFVGVVNARRRLDVPVTTSQGERATSSMGRNGSDLHTYNRFSSEIKLFLGIMTVVDAATAAEQGLQPVRRRE
jgi:hypothetical protein